MGTPVTIDTTTLRTAATDVTGKVEAYAERRSTVGWRPVDACGASSVGDITDFIEVWYGSQWSQTRNGVGGLGRGAAEVADVYDETTTTITDAFVQVF